MEDSSFADIILRFEVIWQLNLSIKSL